MSWSWHQITKQPTLFSPNWSQFGQLKKETNFFLIQNRFFLSFGPMKSCFFLFELLKLHVYLEVRRMFSINSLTEIIKLLLICYQIRILLFLWSFFPEDWKNVSGKTRLFGISKYPHSSINICLLYFFNIKQNATSQVIFSE